MQNTAIGKPGNGEREREGNALAATAADDARQLRTPPIVRKCFCGLLSLAWIIGAVLNYFLIILPAYN